MGDVTALITRSLEDSLAPTHVIVFVRDNVTYDYRPQADPVPASRSPTSRSRRKAGWCITSASAPACSTWKKASPAAGRGQRPRAAGGARRAGDRGLARPAGPERLHGHWPAAQHRALPARRPALHRKPERPDRAGGRARPGHRRPGAARPRAGRAQPGEPGAQLRDRFRHAARADLRADDPRDRCAQLLYRAARPQPRRAGLRVLQRGRRAHRAPGRQALARGSRPDERDRAHASDAAHR